MPYSNFIGHIGGDDFLVITEGQYEKCRNLCESIIEQFDKEHKLVKTYDIPKQVTGYEYEVISAYEAIKNGKLECKEMPHEITLKVMNIMDSIRRQWGMKFPCESL